MNSIALVLNRSFFSDNLELHEISFKMHAGAEIVAQMNIQYYYHLNTGLDNSD